MNVMVKMPEDEREPTSGELHMARSIDFLVQMMLSGKMQGLAIAAINDEGEDSCFYINCADGDVLSGPIERLKVMYETNRAFGHLNNTPKNNRSYRSH